jgi:hypothetical protein
MKKLTPIFLLLLNLLVHTDIRFCFLDEKKAYTHMLIIAQSFTKLQLTVLKQLAHQLFDEILMKMT